MTQYVPLEDDGERRDKDDVPPPPRKRIAIYVAVPLALLIAWGAWGHWKIHSAAAAAQRQQQDFAPEVRIGDAKRVDAPVSLTEPGQTVAFDSANLSARSTGYIAERLVDIGSRVHKGDLLLRIAAPDLDQQLLQAQAQIGQNEAAILQAQASLQQAQANVKFANITKFRETTLASQGWETKQNADNSTANAAVNTAGVTSAQAGIAVAEANLKAQQAMVQRLQELTGFERIVAPFDGVITARNIDTGSLVTADSAGATPLLSIARDNVLRVSVYIPQSSAVGVHEGLVAKVTIPELPGRTFDARVSRTGRSLDPTSRSLLTEVDVDNPQGVLRAGLYADVTIEVPREKPGVVVPDESLVFNTNGLQVAVVSDDDTVHFKKVLIYRDFGTSAELQDGLQGDEKLVLTPPVQLVDGGKVKVDRKPAQDGKTVASAG
jgi:RND family efflux transporter MFP subunit